MNKETTHAWLEYIEKKAHTMAEKAADHAGITDPQARKAFIDDTVKMFLDAEREYIDEIEAQRLTAFMRHMKPMFGNDADALSVPVSEIKQSGADRNAVRECLRAIHEALIRLSGAVEEMGKAVECEDIGIPGMFSILRDSGHDAYGVGADAIEILEQLLSVDTTMTSKETGNPFGDAFRALKLKRNVSAAVSVGALTS